MTEPQFPSAEIPAMDDRQIQFLSSLNSVFKEYPDQMQSLSKMIDSFVQTCSPRSNDVEENSRGKMQRELEEMKDKAEDMAKKDEEITEIERQRKEDNRKMEFELQEMTKEGKELAKTKNDTMRADGQREEKYQKINLELREARDKISKMEREITEKDKKLKEMENQSEEIYKKKNLKLREAEKKISKMEGEITEKDKKIKEMENQSEEISSKMSDQLESVQKEMESYKSSFSKVSVELKSVQMKLESYKSRLASLSEKNVQQDQRKVEDISGSNRPSELEKDFCAFFDEDRVDACIAMQTEYSRNDGDFVDIYYPRLACLILETAYEQAKEVHEAFSYTFKEITNIMMNNSPWFGQELWTARKLHMEGNWPLFYTFYFNTPLWGEGSDSLKDVVDEMHLAMKEVAPTCNVETLTQVIKQISYLKWEKWCEDDKTCKFSPCENILNALQKYIFACIKLTWRMVTQMPPMKLEYHSSQFNKDIHKKVSRVPEETRRLTKKDQGEDIRCYLWPGLQDGGGRRIRQAEVLCKLKQK